jgi:lipopolysaccharide export system protein LptC
MALTETSDGLSASARAAKVTEARTARAFEAADRHSRLVRILRIALPLGATGAVSVLVVLTLVRTFTLSISGLTIGSVSVDGTKVTMENPKLTGARPDGSNYVINAVRAIQDLKNPTSIDLIDISGDIGQRDHEPTKLTASTGHYDTATEKMHLSGVVRLKNSSYTVDLKSADIDFKTNLYKTDEAVSVVTSTGMTVTADSAIAEQNATKLSFTGHVKTLVPPQQGRGEGPQMKSSDP